MSDQEEGIVEKLTRERNEARSELETYKQATIDSVEHEVDGSCTIIARSKLLPMFANALADCLGDAPNFITATVRHPSKGTLELTVRKVGGKTPEEYIGELKAEAESLRHQLAIAKGEVRPD